jgi:hypothetical protein
MYSENIRRRRLPLLAVALAVVSLLGCGKKGPPRPPVRMVPATTQDLAIRQRGDEIAIELAYPAATAAGTPLPRLAAVEVLALTRPLVPAPDGASRAPEVTPLEFNAAAKPTLTLTGADLEAAVAGDRIVARLRLAEVRPAGVGQALVMAVRTRAAEGESSALSNLATLVPATPPAPPSALALAAEVDAVALTWQAADGASAGYHVYRRDAASRSYGPALAAVAAGASSHRDTTARYGGRYIYAVTAVATALPLVESALSPEREILYEDRFAPPPPAEVVALAEDNQVRVRWQASTAGDTVGYLVFRREGESGPWRQLTPDPIAALEFRDTGVASGLAVRYRIVPVDGVGNRGEPGSEAATTVP